MVNSELGSSDEVYNSHRENWSNKWMWKHYRTRPNPNLAALTRSEKKGDSEYNNRSKKIMVDNFRDPGGYSFGLT